VGEYRFIPPAFPGSLYSKRQGELLHCIQCL